MGGFKGSRRVTGWNKGDVFDLIGIYITAAALVRGRKGFCWVGPITLPAVSGIATIVH